MCDSGCAKVVMDTDGLPVLEADEDVVDVLTARYCDVGIGVVAVVVVGVIACSPSSVEDCSVTHWRRMWRRE